MGDPEQTDLVDYLAAEAARAASQAVASRGNAEAATECVQREHRAILSHTWQASGCVQNEHTEAASPFEGSIASPDASPPTAPLSPHRLLVCLAVIGWPERELARRTGNRQTTVRRWTGGQSPVPVEVAAWVETLAAFHQAHPAPRAGQGLPA